MTPFAKSDQYLMDCSNALIADLLMAWNFEWSGCCARHSALRLLSKAILQMEVEHSCQIPWPKDMPEWQCQTCQALHYTSGAEDACWICCAEDPGSLPRRQLAAALTPARSAPVVAL